VPDSAAAAFSIARSASARLIGAAEGSKYCVVCRVRRNRSKIDDAPALPRHLSALVGTLNGPPDLARNHDKYLAYPDR
jgi:hypothetical protein